MREIVTVLMLMLPVSAFGQSTDDTQAVRAVVDRFMQAWNKHDATAFAASFAQDADFTNVRGEHVSGRSGIEAFHAPLFATIFKDTHIDATNISMRFIRPDIAAVDVPWKMTGATDPQGNPRPERSGLLIFVMTRDAGRWQITVMHNQDLTPVPPAK